MVEICHTQNDIADIRPGNDGLSNGHGNKFALRRDNASVLFHHKPVQSGGLSQQPGVLHCFFNHCSLLYVCFIYVLKKSARQDGLYVLLLLFRDRTAPRITITNTTASNPGGT